MKASPTNNFAAFRARYGLDASTPIVGPYLGSLNVGGEQVTLKTAAAGAESAAFEYSAGRGWPPAAAGAGHSLVPLRLGPTESVFIVFRDADTAGERVVSVRRDGQELLRVAPLGPPPDAPRIRNSFTIAAWVKPTAVTPPAPTALQGLNINFILSFEYK